MRISDWSSDVCSSDWRARPDAPPRARLAAAMTREINLRGRGLRPLSLRRPRCGSKSSLLGMIGASGDGETPIMRARQKHENRCRQKWQKTGDIRLLRVEKHKSKLQNLMEIT